MHKNYQGKAQVKIDNRMAKQNQKNKQRHSDEIARIQEQRSRKLERELAGYGKPSTQDHTQAKYVALGVICMVVMLGCAFLMLHRRANP